MVKSEELRKRIKALKAGRVAKEAGLTPSTLHDFVRGDTAHLSAVTMATVLPVVERMEADAGKRRGPTQGDRIETGDEQLLLLPAFDIRAAAGDGMLMQDSEPLFFQPFREHWLRRLTRAPIAALALIEVSGDSMAGTLDSGDLILVDTTMTTFRGEGIYVLMVEEALFVKRVSLDPDSGALILVSDNTRYPPMRVTNRERTRIIGRAIWASRTLI